MHPRIEVIGVTTLIYGSAKLFPSPLAVGLEISTFVRKTRPDTPNMSQGRGAFIVLEGLDRSGKTTQTAKLVEKIQSLGKPCKLIKFPGLSSPLFEIECRSNDDDWEND